MESGLLPADDLVGRPPLSSATPPTPVRMSPAAAADDAGSAVADLSAGLVSHVHCTADGHIAIAAYHYEVVPTAPTDLPPEALPPAACPPDVCLGVGRSYLAAVLEAVSCGLSGAVEAQLCSLLHPEVEVRIGVAAGAGPGRRGVAHFLQALRADSSAYDNWHMTLLSAAAPAGGGEVFLWVDETARNVGPLAGMGRPTNRTSRSLTLHRLFLDPSGRITGAWARYQLFEEMWRLMLRGGSEPEGAMEVEEETGERQSVTAAAQMRTPDLVSAGPYEALATAAGEDSNTAGGIGGPPGRRMAAEPASVPDLTALPFVQRLMGRIVEVAAAAASHGLQGEGAAAQAQAAYAVLTGGAPAAPAISGHLSQPGEPAAATALPEVGSAAPAEASSSFQRGAATVPTEAAPGPVPKALGGGFVVGGISECAAVPDFEAQAGRSMGTWLGLVDSSYSGVRDMFGVVCEGLALWDALGLWPHLRGTRGRDAVLQELQRLHAAYDIRIRRGTWAVDRAGRVAFCGWEAQALPTAAATAAAGAALATPGSPGAPGGFAAAGTSPGDQQPDGTPAAASPGPAESISYTFTSLDVYGLSPQGHVTDVIMYRTALPGEAEGVFKKHLLQAPPLAPPQ